MQIYSAGSLSYVYAAFLMSIQYTRQKENKNTRLEFEIFLIRNFPIFAYFLLTCN